MSRRLSQTKRCAVCATPFRLFHATQLCCSRQCGAIRRHRMNPVPNLVNMRKGAQLRRERYLANLERLLEGKSKVESFFLGDARGYSRAKTRYARLERVS